MALHVIGAGFGRTGTNSLKIALERLGFDPCHHMEEVFKHPDQIPVWNRAADGEQVDWNALYSGFGATVDWPGAHYWRELAAHFPQAKVLLSVRPEESWYRSYTGTIGALMQDPSKIPVPVIRDAVSMGRRIVQDQTFRGATDKPSLLAAYRRRTEEVRAAIPPGRLLVFDVAEGWEPLCRFLGKPVPGEPFPHTNSTEAFWRGVRGEG
jgi:hypothetical protein